MNNPSRATPSASSTIPKFSPKYSGSGSIFSLGQIVAAAVSRASDISVLRLGAAAAHQEYQSVVERGATAGIDVPLPSLGDAVELVKSYFNALHVTMPFMRQADVFRQLERLYTGTPPYTGHDKAQDLFQLHMIFAIGAMRSNGRSVSASAPARDHYLTAMDKETHLGAVPPLARVQNLLLVFVFATLHHVGIASTWEIIRQTMRVCVEHGFYSRETAADDPVEEQLRRRNFWSVYISDRHCSQNLGRPVTLSEADVTIDLPRNQDDDEIRAGSPEVPGRYTEVTNLLRHALLRRLGTNARIALNRLSRQDSSGEERAQTVGSWTNALEAWYNSSIVKSTPNNAYETKEYLDINFHRERMKFLSYLVLPSDMTGHAANQSIEHLWQYTLSAYQILLAYQKQSIDGFLAPNWTYVQDVLKSGFGILYCAVGIPEQRGRESRGAPGGALLPAELDTVFSALRLCGETLGQITAEWQTVQRHADAFMYMSEAVLEMIATTARATREGSREDQGGSGGGVGDAFDGMDLDLATLDSTLNMFQGGGAAPFSDAEWAELFDLVPGEGAGDLSHGEA